MTLDERLDMAIRDDEVKLWCVTVGAEHATSFGVVIKKSDSVYGLQCVLKRQQFDAVLDMRPSTLDLYIAKDDKGQWLDDSADIDELIAGNQTATSHWLREKLDPLRTIAENFHPYQEGKIHVIVLRPVKFEMEEEEHHEKYSTLRLKTANALADTPEVSELVSTVQNLNSLGQQVIPFILLVSSSGMGKTQMAYNLMLRPELDVFCVVCGEELEPVRWAFFHRSNSFARCVEKDVLTVGEAEVSDMLMQPELHTYAFIFALVHDLPTFTGPRTREEVVNALKYRQATGRRCVFFLDQFPGLDTSVGDEDKIKWTRKVRFIRNVFRSFGLPVIVSATNRVTKDLLQTAMRSKPGDELWCVVFPLLPRFQDPSMSCLRGDLQAIISHSRPLFAKVAVDYVHLHPLDDNMDLKKYMNRMVATIGVSFVGWSRYFCDEFDESHVRMFLAGSYCTHDHSSHLPIGDFSCLDEPEAFQLWLRDSDCPVKDENGAEPWRWRSVFPGPREEAFLHLCLGTIYGVNDNAARPISFYDAYFSRANEKTDVGMVALVTGAIVIASRQNGFDGVPFTNFFSALLFELGVMKYRHKLVKIPKGVLKLDTSVVVSFLAPLTVAWPEFLVATTLNLGTLMQIGNADENTINVRTGTIFFHCNFSQHSFTNDDLKTCFQQVPVDCAVILVFVSAVQSLQSFFTLSKRGRKQNRFNDATRRYPWLNRAVFYRIDTESSVEMRRPRLKQTETIEHITNNCNSVTCTGERVCNHVDKLVIFVEIAGVAQA